MTLEDRIIARYQGKLAGDDPWLDREDIAKICPSCADRMASKGIRKVRASVIFNDDQLMAAIFENAGQTREAAWEGLPKGWTQKSVDKFWGSLTGDVKHKVTKCIEKMKGSKGVDDPGAFCASLADKVEGKGWRS